VATPGRLADFLDRGLVSLKGCRFLVLDEADRMLDMGFAPQLDKIVEQSNMPARKDRQTLLFSATFPEPLRVVAQKSYLRANFARVAVGKVGASNRAVEQRIVRIEGGGTKHDKLDVLTQLLKSDGNKGRSTIVFTNKKHVANWIARQLTQKQISCSQIHGDRTQGQRETALQRFRDERVDVLVATDAVSRGIDVPNVAHVVQFDLPFGVKEFESYTHRIGRTGRAGKTGIATSFYVPGHQPKVGNGELWPLIKEAFDESGMELPEWFYMVKEAFDESGMELPEWFYKEENNKIRGKPNRRAPSQNTSRSPVRVPSVRKRATPSKPNASAVNASGFKNKKRRSRRESTPVGNNNNRKDDAELKVWLDDILDEPSTTKKKKARGK